MRSTALCAALALATAAYAGLGALKLGEEAKLEGGAVVKFAGVASDSRCPEDVECMWAGEATLDLTLTDGGQTETFQLVTPPNPKSVAQVGGWRFELQSLKPERPKKEGQHREYMLSLGATRATTATK